jgi:hypothetical protein
MRRHFPFQFPGNHIDTLVFLAYLPQLGSRLHLTHTQLNVFAVAGNGTASKYPLLPHNLQFHISRDVL